MFGFLSRSTERFTTQSKPGEQVSEVVTTSTKVAVGVVIPLANTVSVEDSEQTTTSSASFAPEASGPLESAGSSRQEVPSQSRVAGEVSVSQETAVSKQPGDNGQSSEEPTRPAIESERRRFSWRTLSFLGGDKRDLSHKTQHSPVQERKRNDTVLMDHALREHRLSRSDRRARASAEVVRTLIVGPDAISPAQKKVKPVSKRKLERVKSELINPKSANKVIAQLRAMPSSDPPIVSTALAPGSGPIHAVCFAYTDEEAHERHFSKLSEDSDGTQESSERSPGLSGAIRSVANVTNASLSQLTALLSELHVVSLLTAPNLGIGQPGDGPGLLSGAVPTADTVLEGVQEITPQLMALGYATGKAILPDHAGVHPPTDRMSIITYWWGLEVVLPPPSIRYLSNVPSIAHAIINFLTGLSLVNPGVREILPFIRYISQYIDSEFNMIKDNDKGKGVVCAATWIFPAALVPRPWDFPDPSSKDSNKIGGDGSVHSKQPPEREILHPTPTVPEATLPSHLPLPLPGPLSTFTSPNAAPPIDETSVEVQTALDESVPDVLIIPPTPPAADTLRHKPDDIQNLGGAEGIALAA